MTKKLFDLSDDDVAALERLRVKIGARSHVEALRALIRQADGEAKRASTQKAAAAQPRPLVRAQHSTDAVGSDRGKLTISVPYIGDLVRKPYQKGTKK